MTIEKAIEELKKFPKDFELFSLNEEAIFCRVAGFEKDDNYDDVLILNGKPD